MKKLIILALFAILLIPQKAFSNDNFIYSINVGTIADTNSIVLNIKSDYKSKIRYKIDENDRRYFDIKDASLKENFSVTYNNAPGVEGVIAQQIGNKVRIYVKGNDSDNVSVSFNNVEAQAYPDKSAAYALLLFGAIMLGILSLFNKKSKKPAKKTTPAQNYNSKQVYKQLMEKNPNLVYDKSKLTLNSLKRRGDIVRGQMSGQMSNISLAQRQKQMQSQRQNQGMGSRIAM